MEVSPSTIFSMGQFASRHKTALYTFEHQHGYFADGPEVFEESMDEYIGNSIEYVWNIHNSSCRKLTILSAQDLPQNSRLRITGF